MPQMRESKQYLYSGALADACSGLVAEKKALGLSYDTYAQKLDEFIRFSAQYKLEPHVLPEELVINWITKRPGEKDTNRVQRYKVVRVLAEYMLRRGMSAYMATSDDIGRTTTSFVPYIFTHEEIIRFFSAADNMSTSKFSAVPRHHIIMPLLWRMLYCCELRVSEATGLLGSDVDMRHGVLTIRESKGGKSRYVPMSPQLVEKCLHYDKTRLKQSGGNDWFFATPQGGEYCDSAVYKAFRKVLTTAGISHGGVGNGPRLHDFRHTFSVHCLQKWIKEGNELTSALPYLSAYLGHDGFDYTQSYLRMTAEVYPDISNLIQKQYGYMIPKFEEAAYEND
jgi:integrase